MYLPQQQPPAGHYNVTGPGFAPYQPYANVAQPQIIRQQYTGPQSHHYPQAGQIMPMNTVTGAAGTNAAIPPGIMPDNSAILAATTQPHMHYMPNTPTMLPQQPQQHHMQPLAPAAAAKQSKAIKIVNPETMKEVDTSNLKKTSPASSARSTPKPNSESEQVQQQFKQTVNRAVDLKGNDVAKQPAVTPNAIIRQPKIPKTDSNEFRKVRCHANCIVCVCCSIFGASLSEPHHRRSTVKSVFLLACLLDTSSLIWLSANQYYIKLEWCVNC